MIGTGTLRARHETNEAGCSQRRGNWQPTDTKSLLALVSVGHASSDRRNEQMEVFCGRIY